MDTLKAETIAKENMTIHGLNDWSFDFDDAVQRRGCCHYSRKEITLSKALTAIRDEQWVINTILHEIAHALVGQGNGHNQIWKHKAVEIGCTGERCSSDAVAMPKPFRCVCPNCGNGWTAHKRTKVACGLCCKKFNGGKWTPKYRVTWSRVSI